MDIVFSSVIILLKYKGKSVLELCSVGLINIIYVNLKVFQSITPDLIFIKLNL